MVVRNAGLRMNGLPVGGWDDKLDAERLRMEIVEAFEACILDNALRKREDPEKSSSDTRKSGFDVDDSRPKRSKVW